MAQVDDDIPGQIGDLLRIGTIDAVDLPAARATVRCGDIVSPPVPWLELAGGFRSWVPPVAGEQVVLMCPEADIAHGVILRGLYSTAFPPPLTTATARILMPDGGSIDYDPAAHRLVITPGAGGSVDIVANVNVTGTLTASVDVIGGGKSLKSHKHGGVQTGGGQTGAPA